jgi:DNA polymerase elongation subunit (family B)
LKNKKLAKDTNDKYYKDLEQSQKVGINSMYGFLGSSGLNFNYPNGASEVTRRGREVLGMAIKWATGNTYEEWKPKDEKDESDSGT